MIYADRVRESERGTITLTVHIVSTHICEPVIEAHYCHGFGLVDFCDSYFHIFISNL
jgi:hypothetical protein